MKRVRVLNKYDDKLATCPFCGSPAQMTRALMVTGMIVIRCTNDKCGADIVFSGCELSEEKSLEHFNRRAGTSCS